MRYKFRLIVCGVIALLCFVGYCDNSDSVLVVNGVSISAAEYQRRIDMFAALARIRNPKVDADKLQSNIRKMRTTEYRNLAQRMAIETTLFSTNKNSSVVLTNSIDAIKAQYVRSFLPRGNKKRESVAARFEVLRQGITKSGYGDLFDKNFNFDVQLDAYFRLNCANQITASAEEIEAVRKSVEEYNRIASSTNTLQEALCSQLISRARAGEDFAMLADEFSQDEDKDAGGHLGECTEVDFTSEPGYWISLEKIPEGGVTDLIVTTEGYEVVKVNRILSANDSSSGTEALDLSRIFRRKAYVFPDQTNEEFAADITKEKREKFYKEFIKDIMRKSKIEYPQGKKVFK